MPKRRKTKSEYLQDIVKEYIDAGEEWPAEKQTIAAWAIRNKLWTPPKQSLVEKCAQELADAMRIETEKDPQGRTIRSKYAATIREKDEEGKYTQKTLWFDSHTGPPKLMKISFQQRRTGIEGDCKKLRTDVDSYNDNNPHGAKIPMSFDFTYDVLEGGESTDYQPPKFDEEDNEDEN